MPPAPIDPKVRFERHYTPEPSTGCWLWLGAYSKVTGYGNFRVSSREIVTPAHRASWRLHCGPVPDGAQVCHRCDVRLCVNPDHLFIGTAKDNMRDASRKGRMNWKHEEKRDLPVGVAHHAAKLSDDQVLEIRASHLPGVDLAERFGVSSNTISRIRKRQNWRHLP